MKYFATQISENMHETPEGYLVCLAVPIGRTGFMEYGKGETPLDVGPDGRVMVYRDEEEIFRPETMASFEGKPFTIKHPEEFVDPSNWKALAKGIIQNVRRGDGDHKEDLLADILITDEFAISLVKNGLRGLSCGYEAEYFQTDIGAGLQKNIIGNHLALVDEGRAGDSYAINDSKGDFRMSKKMTDKLADKFHTMFGKTVDKAAIKKAIDEASETDAPVKESKDSPGYDEMVKMCDEFATKMKDMMASMKPAAKDEPAPKPKEDDKSKDADVSSGLEDRLKALEMAVQKLMEGQSEAGDEDEGEEEDAGDDGDIITDEGGDGEEETGDEEKDPKLTGDEASRAEILAPGIKETKDVKAAALKVAYATADGKKAIDTLLGGKKMTYDSAEKVDMIFTAASEMLKSSRKGSLKSKIRDFSSNIFEQEGAMTPEKMNEINAKHFNK